MAAFNFSSLFKLPTFKAPAMPTFSSLQPKPQQYSSFNAPAPTFSSLGQTAPKPAPYTPQAGVNFTPMPSFTPLPKTQYSAPLGPVQSGARGISTSASTAAPKAPPAPPAISATPPVPRGFFQERSFEGESEQFWKRLGEESITGISYDKAKTAEDVKAIDQATESKGLTFGQLVEMGKQYGASKGIGVKSGVSQYGSPVAEATQGEPTAPPAPSGAGAGTPAVPEVSPDTTAAMTAAEKARQDSLKISPEMLSTQEDIDKLLAKASAISASYELGAVDIEGQPIEMSFIVGQKQSLEARALAQIKAVAAQAEPLEKKMARLEAVRLGAQAQSRFSLERADKAIENARKNAQVDTEIVTAGNRKLLVNSKTGVTIKDLGEAEAPTGFTLGEDQARYSADGSVIATNVGSEGLSEGFGGKGYVRGENPTVDSYVDLINKGTYKISDVPKKLKTAVTNALAAGGTEEDAIKVELLQEKVNQISNLVNHRGMSKSVGPTGLGRWTPFKPDTWTGDTQDFVASVHQLTSKETLQFLIDVKAAGATFGALSNQELKVLSESATKINDWELKDKNGEGSGKWNISETKFKAELSKIQDMANRALTRALGEDASGQAEYELYLKSIGAL